MKKSQSGFTLVEIAIVLVIIGLLLGGVLKGQSMVENARVKALANDFRGVQAMLYAYQDKFRAIPGDDAAVATRLPTATAPTTNAGNGLIDNLTWVGAAAPAAPNKSSLFWQHVRLAGLTTGVATSGQGTNAVGGPLGITTNLLRVTTPANVPGTYFICSGGINGSLAQQLDIAMDDGAPNTGTMFSAAGNAIVAATAADAAWVPATIYTVCLAF